MYATIGTTAPINGATRPPSSSASDCPTTPNATRAMSTVLAMVSQNSVVFIPGFMSVSFRVNEKSQGHPFLDSPGRSTALGLAVHHYKIVAGTGQADLSAHAHYTPKFKG